MYCLKHWKEENERAKNFHVWHPNKRKFSVWSEYYNQFGIYQPSCVSLLKPHHLSKNSILDVWQCSESASVIWYSLFGKIEDANTIDSVAV